MALKHDIYRFFSIQLWGNLPAWLQRKISQVYADLYNQPFSKHLIRPYCKVYYKDPNYLQSFRPASGREDYLNFQDFFTRKFKEGPEIKSDTVWACEGLLCEYGKVANTPLVRVKGQKRHLRTIFGEAGPEIPDDYYFSNVFLHNSNYHRIHSPIRGAIERIERIAGDLVLLRPWVYNNTPSLPALRNERVNVDIISKTGEKWFLSIVGGPAVGSIVLKDGLRLGSMLEPGEEISTFLLGSTLCIAAPKPLSDSKVGEQVNMGDPF